MGKWFGVDAADMGAVLPNRDNFAQSGRLFSEADMFTSDRSDFSEVPNIDFSLQRAAATHAQRNFTHHKAVKVSY